MKSTDSKVPSIEEAKKIEQEVKDTIVQFNDGRFPIYITPVPAFLIPLAAFMAAMDRRDTPKSFVITRIS